MRPVDFEIPLVYKPFKGEYKITANFGVRAKVRDFSPHKGVDYALPEGTPVFACMDGRALCRGHEDGNKAGNRVLLFNYARGIEALYFHLKDFAFHEPNRDFKVGDLLGWSGNTGHSTGPHLHFEIRKLTDASPMKPYFIEQHTLEEVLDKAPYGLPEETNV